MNLREAAEMALEALEFESNDAVPENLIILKTFAINELRQALAQDSLKKLAEIDRELGLFDEPMKSEQEPETVMAKYEFQTYAAYKIDGEMKIGVVPEQESVDAVNMSQERVDETVKNRHKWVGLTEDEFEKVLEQNNEAFPFAVYQQLEAKLKEKNG